MTIINRTMPLPSSVEYVLSKLKENGYQAYVVGGAVRDFLMGKTPHDYDLTSDALPSQISDVFKDFYQEHSGEKHGTIRVIIDHKPIEITTFRCDEGYTDYRRPDNVEFVKDVYIDSKRRDFSINAFYYSEGHIYDFHEGLEDLNNKVIKTIGNPFARFHEDALRILRAIRFSAKLGYEIESKTKTALLDCKEELNLIAKERILIELKEISSTSNFFRNIKEYFPIFKLIIPCLDKIGNSIDDIYNFDTKSYGDYIASLSALFSLREINNDFMPWRLFIKMDNESINAIKTLIKLKDINFNNSFDDDYINGLILLSKPVDINVFKNYLINLYNLKRLKNDDIDSILNRVGILSEGNTPYSLKDLEIDGNDLLKLGIKKNQYFKEILNEVLLRCNQGDLNNNRNEEIEFVKKWIRTNTN
ncbi:tRNA nucleotidyltransferase/poly(A) polymerase family protein [Clostridium sp. CAG:568]|nr:tRNA nucleotidyltransferase/poly(A) polymerase family protein [Clostridium sp. CAG:568]